MSDKEKKQEESIQGHQKRRKKERTGFCSAGLKNCSLKPVTAQKN